MLAITPPPMFNPNKPYALMQLFYSVGPASLAVAQHYNSITSSSVFTGIQIALCSLYCIDGGRLTDFMN